MLRGGKPFLIDPTFEADPEWGPAEIAALPFVPGATLAERYYHEAVAPILSRFFPDVPYSAALIGPGSDVLGYDTRESMDHNWAPRLTLFLREEDAEAARKYCPPEFAGRRRRMLVTDDPEVSGQQAVVRRKPHALAEDMDYVLRRDLPDEVCGIPTSILGYGPDSGALRRRKSGGVNHFITFQTVAGFLRAYLEWNGASKPTVLEWLTFPEHRLAALRRSRVFHDGLGTLEAARERLAYYPDAVWRYLLAAQWARIGTEESYLGRAGAAGDELGSRLVAARLAHYLMRLGFLMERVFPPFTKWFGRGFSELSCAGALSPPLLRLQAATDYAAREEALCDCYRIVVGLHNRLGITEPLSAEAGPFQRLRPYRVIHGELVSRAISRTITDPELRALRGTDGFGLIGSIDQVADGVIAVLDKPQRFARLRALYRWAE